MRRSSRHRAPSQRLIEYAQFSLDDFFTASKALAPPAKRNKVARAKASRMGNDIPLLHGGCALLQPRWTIMFATLAKSSAVANQHRDCPLFRFSCADGSSGIARGFGRWGSCGWMCLCLCLCIYLCAGLMSSSSRYGD